MTPRTTAASPHRPLPLSLSPTVARAATATGAGLTLAATHLAWTWTDRFPGDLTAYASPRGLQVLTLTGATLTLLFLLSGWGVPGLRWLTPGGRTSPVVLLSLGTLATTGYTLGAIAVRLGGLVNLEPGGWLAGVGALLTAGAALGLPHDTPPADDPPAHAPDHRLRGARRLAGGRWPRALVTAPEPGRPRRDLPAWAEVLVICLACALALCVFVYGIGTEYPELFLGFLLLTGFAAPALDRAGLLRRLSALAARHRGTTLTAAFVAAALFPFTQRGDAYTSVATSVLIFATVALGLNVVVGLAGLLDLGYVAFLGVGAYTAALVSGAPTASLGVRFPFWAAVLTGALVSLLFGVLIGAPTLRLRGDYLAIVTLGFGEIFRIAMQNLDGDSGPDLTNGPNGIPSIPDLRVLGFDFGREHQVLGFELGRFGNYYLLMLLCTALVVAVFRRVDRSRVGRAWLAIREDETAARAMGINAFRLKLTAFALGATLAGLAGTVLAHVEYGVHPDSYKFVHTVPPNSAFLLVAVILGGMGTVSGPLVGAALLYLVPSKLQFLTDYQLLLFGVTLVLLMRFRPEGLVADRRKRLEFHAPGPADPGRPDAPTDPTGGVRA